MAGWLDRISDPDELRLAARFLAPLVIGSTLAGLIIVIGLNWTAVTGANTLPSAASTLAPADAQTMGTPTPLSTPAPLVLGPLPGGPGPTARPTEAAGLPSATPASPTAASQATTSEQAWQDLQPRLDASWATNTPETITLLEGFLAEYPSVALAREKLYAALLANGNDLVSAGDPSAGAEQLTRAAELLPDRPEAQAALASLTPTPTSTPTATLVSAAGVSPPPTATATPRSAEVTSRRAPAAPVAPAPAPVRPAANPPTPTKVPFRAPVAP